jgi:hypothetical protein
MLGDEVEPLIPGVAELPMLLPLPAVEPVVPWLVVVPAVPRFGIVSLDREPMLPEGEEVPLPVEGDGLPIVEPELPGVAAAPLPVAPEDAPPPAD